VTIRVGLADDQALVRAGFRMIVESHPDMEVAGEAADGQEAIELVRRERHEHHRNAVAQRRQLPRRLLLPRRWVRLQGEAPRPEPSDPRRDLTTLSHRNPRLPQAGCCSTRGYLTRRPENVGTSSLDKP